MRPGLTFAIPSYNMERWLPVAVESCLAQSDPDIEIVIVNDGSPDRTGEIADAYAALDPRVRVIHQENRGSGATRQAGQDAASGEYITWVDADDFLDRHAARDLLDVARRDGVDMVCGNAVVFSSRSFNARRYFSRPAVSRTTFENPNYWKSKVCWRWIFRTDWVRELGLRHHAFKFGQGALYMFDALTRVDRFSQCPSQFYYFRQEHKGTCVNAELRIEHMLAHFAEARRILLDAGRIKPLIKYLNENYLRDIRKTAKLLAGAPDLEAERWLDRCVELGLETFEGLRPEWFAEEFLVPKLRPEPKLLPLAEALMERDAERAREEIRGFMPTPAKAGDPAPREGDKKHGWHALRRRIKSLLNPLSHKARSRLRALESSAAEHLGPLWLG